MRRTYALYYELNYVAKKIDGIRTCLIVQKGLWLGIILAISAQVVIYSVVILRTNWDEQVSFLLLFKVCFNFNNLC